MDQDALAREQDTAAQAGRVFISYSRSDGVEFARRLADELEAVPPRCDVWLDERQIHGGRQDWDDQLTRAIETCDALIFVMTPDSVQRGSGCKDEWDWALRYKKPVIPVRADPDAVLPFRLGSRQYVDLSGDFSGGLAQLRLDLRALRTPEGELRELEVRLAEAERKLRRTSADARGRVEQETVELRTRIDAQRRTVADPGRAAREADERIVGAIERERRPDRRAAAPATKFINRLPLTAPTYFQDRHIETTLLAEFLRDDGARLMWVVGRGGTGKTAMVCRLLTAVERGRLPDDLGELSADGIVYLSPRSGRPLDFPHMYADLCRLLPDAVGDELSARARDPSKTPAALMRGLLEQFADGRWILLLDNFEDVVDADCAGLTDPAFDEALRTMLHAPPHTVKVIVTTRFAPKTLLVEEPGVQRQVYLDEGLPSPYAEEVLRAMDPDGRLGLKTAPHALLAEARERTRGFPRALEALKGILAADRDTTLPELLATTEGLPGNVVEALVGAAFNRLDALAQQVMQALAIYRGPVPAVAVDYLLQPYHPAIDSAPVLSRLVNMQFARSDAGRYFLHQVDRDYALARVPGGDPHEPPAFTRSALRQRAADYFEQTRAPRETWQSLDDLVPQLAEVDLRCEAGAYDAAGEVLVEIYSDLRLWGQIRLARGLLERVTDRVTDPLTKAVLLGDLALCYEHLGEVHKAIETNERALAIDQEIGSRANEGVVLGNLGVCYARIGQPMKAIEYYERALAIDRETGNRWGEVARLHNLGRRYAELGDDERAIELFDEALTLARELNHVEGVVFLLTALGGSHRRRGETHRAIDSYQEALAVARDRGHRPGESGALRGLVACHCALGATSHAIELCEQALAIDRDTGDRANEAAGIADLADCHADLGDTARALAMIEEALTIYREIGDRTGEAISLQLLASGHADAGAWQQAIEAAEASVAVADDLGFARGSCTARLVLARSQLGAGAFPEARRTAEAAQAYDYAPLADNIGLILGIAALRDADPDAATVAFRQAVEAAEALLARTDDAHDELDVQALALCGLTVIEGDQHASAAGAAFAAARAITRADGIVARVLGLFDAIAAADQGGRLAEIRTVAAGATRSADTP